MENAEVEVALEELENRLERLRALYEQYFMGIERIEPAIPRKDVDRRIYVLRREKIRNTAKRFKLQTIISRYNTFQQYWQRICREIENGTYKRHLIRAERIAPGQMLTIAARKRLGRAALEMATPDSAPPPARDSARPSARPSPEVVLPSLAAAAAAAPASSQPIALPGIGVPLSKAVPPPKPGARPAKPSAAVAAPAPKFESLDLDLDFLGDWDPSTSAAKGKRGAPEVPARPFGRALNQPLGAAPPPAPLNAGQRTAKPAVSPAPPPAPPRVVTNAPGERPLIAPRPPPAPTGLAPAAVAAARPAPARPVLVSSPIPGTAPPRPAPSAQAAPAVAKPAQVAAPAAAAPSKLAAKPTVTAPGVVAAFPKPPAAKPATTAGTVTDDRVRELHARLVEAKRQTQDAAAVSMEGLARSMKATEAKLREQHKNRKIDFDVVIKDGKAVLKPIVR